jgi:ubiquinone/menaquinone biosynthesis C-methylase UbiE
MKPWEKFFRERMERILREKKSLIDIGGGLRVSKEKGNRFERRNAWIADTIRENSVAYKILDPVSDYKPDIVGDIHNLPFKDNSQEALSCIAVLEHVLDPFKASEEMFRVLKPGGMCMVYVPFLYYFHAEKGYYGDYWRFTKEGLALMFKKFSSVEIQPVRGAIGTLVRLTPLGRFRALEHLAYLADIVFRKLYSNQVSGYFVFLIK